MAHLLVPLLLAAAGAAAPAGKTPVIQYEESSAAPQRALVTAEDFTALCGALTPTERVRAKGDAVDQGEAAARHGTDRDAALAGRYEVIIPAAKLAFAPYDGPEHRLGIAEPAQLVPAAGDLRLWPVAARDLPVEVDASSARRILEAQRTGRLALVLVFDLPEDAACGGPLNGKKPALGVDPIDWRWIEGVTVLARGGASADRPVVTAAQGARPKVEVGEPIAGPQDAKKAVLARVGELEGCYAEALKRDPGIDGVLVAELSGASPAIAADSTGSPELAACVQRVLAPLAPSAGGIRVAVPIRFELVAPRAAATVPAAAGQGR